LGNWRDGSDELILPFTDWLWPALDASENGVERKPGKGKQNHNCQEHLDYFDFGPERTTTKVVPCVEEPRPMEPALGFAFGLPLYDEFRAQVLGFLWDVSIGDATEDEDVANCD